MSCLTWTTCFHTSSVLRALRRRVDPIGPKICMNFTAQTPLWSGRELLKFCNVNLNPFNPKGRKKHSANSNPVAVTRLQVSKNADVLVGYLAWLLRVPLIPRQDFCQLFVCWEITLTNHHNPGFQACGFLFSQCHRCSAEELNTSLSSTGLWLLTPHVSLT